LDYELVQSTNPEFNKAVVRVNVFREHRQTIQVRTIQFARIDLLREVDKAKTMAINTMAINTMALII
jgi:hypothetical protein